MGQLPLHVGAVPLQNVPDTHSHPESPSRQLEPTGQSPPQLGAAEFMQKRGVGKQRQASPCVPHSSSAGQAPLHSGAVPPHKMPTTHSHPESPSSRLIQLDNRHRNSVLRNQCMKAVWPNIDRYHFALHMFHRQGNLRCTWE